MALLASLDHGTKSLTLFIYFYLLFGVLNSKDLSDRHDFLHQSLTAMK